MRHRGAPDDERAVPGSRIVEVKARGVLIEAEVGLDSEQLLAEGQVLLPYHRVLRVHDASGQVIFRGQPPPAPAAKTKAPRRHARPAATQRRGGPRR